jgi:hypothetical protein
MTPTMLNEGRTVSRGAAGRQTADFTLAIDDQRASELYDSFDSASPMEQEQYRSALRNWAETKLAEEQSRNDDDLTGIYADVNRWWEDSGGGQADDEVKFGAANRKFIAAQTNQTAREMGDLYPSERDRWFLQNMGKAPKTESEAFELVRKSFETKKQSDEAYNLIAGDIALSLFDQVNKGTPVDIPTLMTKWKEENAEILDALPDNWEANTLKAAEQYYVENEQMLRDHGDVLQRLYANIINVTGRKVEGAPEDDVKTVEDLNAIIDGLGELPKEVRDRGYAAIFMAAKRQGMDDKGFWEMAAEAWPRSLNMVRTTALVAQETDAEAKVALLQGEGPLFRNKNTGQLTRATGTAFSPQDFEEVGTDDRGTLLQQAERELQRFNVVRELRDLADNRFDPVKSNATGTLKFVQDIALLGPQSLAYTGVAAIPVVGPVLTGAAIYADEYNQLRLEGFTPSQSRTLAAVSAPLQTAAEVFGAKLVFGRYKWYRETIQKLVNPARFARTTQGAVSFFGKVVGENITEGTQDLTTPLVQDVAAALSDEFPDVNWEETLTQWKDSRLEVLAATLMPVIGGHMVETFADGERFASAERRQKIMYDPTGINEQERRYIEDGTTPQERRNRYVETLKNMPPERVQRAKDRIAEQSRAAATNQEDAAMPTMETQKDTAGRMTYIVRDEKGVERYRTTSQQAAEDAYRMAVMKSTAAQFSADRIATKELIDWWTQQDPNNVVRLEGSRTAQQELERLQGLGDTAGIETLHRRIAQDPRTAGQDYSTLTILGTASIETVAEGVFRGVIALNESSRPKDALEEINHVFVRRAVAQGSVNEQQLRDWLTATEAITGETYAKDNFDDIIESLAIVAEAYVSQRIDQNAESQLPASFVDYLKRLVQVLKEVMARGLALRRGFADGTLGQDYEQFLAESVGLADQTIVDRSREKTAQNVAPEMANYSIGALGDDNPFMHPRGADGKYKGAPKWVNAPKTRRGKDEAYMRLRERLYQLVKEGEAGRFWYEDSGRAVLRMFNNDVVEAEKFIELLAIYSPQATVEVNTYFALRAYIQRAVNAAKEDFAVKTGTQDDKAKAVLYDNQPWAGRKTDNFYKNIMYVLLKELPASEVAKLKLDAEVYEMLQKPVTVDMWVYRAFGFDSDALTDVAGTGAFGFAERELNLIAEELNASLPEGAAPYLPHQIQAMLWTSIKGRSETKEVKDLTEAQSMKAKDMVKVKNAQGKLVREFKDKEAQKRHMQRWITNALALPAERLDVSMAAGAFDRFINSVSMRALWESVPSTNTPEGIAITNLPTAQKAAFTRASREIILDENGNDMLAAMLGVPVNVSQLLSGGYGTGATPNVVTELFPNKPSGTYDDDVVRAYARAIQYIFRQDAVPWMRYIKYGAENEKSYYAESPKGAKRRFATQAEAEAYAAGKEGYVVKGDAENFAVRLDFGEQLTPDFLDQLQQGLVKVHESLGFTQVSPTQLIVTNFRDADTGLPALTDEQFSERIQNEYGEQADIQRLFTVGEYGPVHDWSADQTGEGLLSGSSRFGSDLLEWLRGRRQISDALQKDWAEGRGVSNYSIASSGNPRIDLEAQLKELQAGEPSPVDTGKTFWLIASSSGDIVDILDNEQDATSYFQTTASTGEWLWEYKDGLRTKVPLLKRGVAERRADGYIDTVRQEQENAGRVFYSGADTSAETTTSAGEIPSYTPDGQPWAGQEESVVYHGGRLFDPQGTDQGGYGQTQTLKPRRPYQTYLYSISTQSEIDRVGAALNRLARSPSERISQYAALKERLAAALERNKPIMQSMRGDMLPQDFDRTRILNDLGFLDYILKVLPPEVRGRVGGYTNLASIAPVDVYKGDQKVSEAKNPAGAIISAWMREGQNIGQAQKNTALPEGYSTVPNTTDERRDKTIANFLIDRLKKIDRELERYYKRDLMERIFDVLDKSRPKAGQSGVKRSTLGAETQKFADMVYRSSLLDDEKTAERLAAIEAQITSTEATADSQKRISELSEEWTIVNTFGDLKSRPSETLAYGLEWLQTQLKAGREAWQIKEAARIQENRERAAKVIAFLGKPTDFGRFENKSALQRFLQAVNAFDLDHKSFDQFAPYLFGDEVAAELSKKMQRAQIDEAKLELENTRSILAALRQGAKAAGMSTSKALVAFKENQPYAVRKMEGRKVKDTKISIELAKKIVRGLADRGSLSNQDVQTLSDELAALPRDTRKENVTIQQVIFRGEEVRLTMSRAQAMQLWLTWQQSDAQEKMRADGFTDDSFDDLDNLISGPFAQAILRVTSRIYGSGYALTNPIYARMFGMNMPMVRNYAPARYLSSKEVKDVGLDGSPLTAGGQPSFAKSRVNHTAKLAPEDALTVLQSHIAMQSHWVAFAEVTREYRSLLSNPDVRESIRQRLGADVLRTAEMWGDQMEQRGGNKGREIAWINNMLGAVIGGQSVSLLGYNLKSLMMQTDNLMRFTLALDSRQIGSALSDPVALMQNVRKVWKTDIIQTRLEGGATAETRFFFERFVSMFRRGAKVAEMSMMPMNYLDSAGLSISGAIVYQAAYKDALDSGVDPTSAERAAKDAVEAMVYRYGQPVLMGQKSNIENSGNAFTKAFFLFMSDPRLKMAIISDSVRGLATGRGDWKTHVRRIVAIEMMAVVSHVLATAFRDATSDDDDEDLWSMGGFARALLLAPFQGYFLLGSVSDLVLSRLTEAQWFTPTQNPLIRTADTAFRAFNNLDDAFNFDDPDALVKEWTNITRSIALTPPLAAPAVIMNIVRPLVQGWERMDDDE